MQFKKIYEFVNSLYLCYQNTLKHKKYCEFDINEDYILYNPDLAISNIMEYINDTSWKRRIKNLFIKPYFYIFNVYGHHYLWDIKNYDDNIKVFITLDYYTKETKLLSFIYKNLLMRFDVKKNLLKFIKITDRFNLDEYITEVHNVEYKETNYFKKLIYKIQYRHYKVNKKRGRALIHYKTKNNVLSDLFKELYKMPIHEQRYIEDKNKIKDDYEIIRFYYNKENDIYCKYRTTDETIFRPWLDGIEYFEFIYQDLLYNIKKHKSSYRYTGRRHSGTNFYESYYMYVNKPSKEKLNSFEDYKEDLLNDDECEKGLFSSMSQIDQEVSRIRHSNLFAKRRYV